MYFSNPIIIGLGQSFDFLECHVNALTDSFKVDSGTFGLGRNTLLVSLGLLTKTYKSASVSSSLIHAT